jgi:hypothetical protein
MHMFTGADSGQVPTGIIASSLALLLTAGSLVIYLVGAVIGRAKLGEEGKTIRTFNLSLPRTHNLEELFAISLVSAETTLSTVFVLFLTSGGALGFHLLFCPIAFGAGLLLMRTVYEKMEQRGFMGQPSISGLVPHFAYCLTRSRIVCCVIAILCTFPLLAILSLELRYGILFLDYMVPGGSHHSLEQAVFVGFMALLLGYVFVGGFRAVIASDVLQYKMMRAGLTFTFISVFVIALRNRSHLNWDSLQKPDWLTLATYYCGITIINLFSPLSLATTWHRFRAFRDHKINVRKAVHIAIAKSIYLWGLLIAIGIILQLLTVGRQLPGSQPLYGILNQIISQNDWFRFFVFPLLTVAAFSGMYSSSDTCVSALLYLTETPNSWRSRSNHDGSPIGSHYYWMMACLFALTSVMYQIVKHATDVTNGLIHVALNIFGNTVVIAPTVLLMMILNPGIDRERGSARTRIVLLSIAVGLLTYWSLATLHLSSWDTLGLWPVIGGFLAASVPAIALVGLESRLRKENKHGRGAAGNRGDILPKASSSPTT